MTDVLTRLDAREIPKNFEEIRVFTTVHNEMVRLPYFLKYYRNMGVSRFLFIDNNSTDGTREYLLSQPDCHVHYTKNSFGAAKGGITWSRAVLDLYGVGHWCLVIDADEIFVFPHSEDTSLKEFCTFLDKEGSDVVYSFLLDMYPKGNVADAVCQGDDKSFMEIAPYFDKDYTFVDRISLSGKNCFPPQEVIGGPRTRCFYGNQGDNSYFKRFTMHFIERSIVALRKYGIKVPYWRLKATPLFKIPLIKWQIGYEYTASTHQMIPHVKLSQVTGALLHFKFFSDFHKKCVAAVTKAQHAEGGIEYKQALKNYDQLDKLMYSGSTYYNSPNDLINAKLIKTSDAFESFVNS